MAVYIIAEIGVNHNGSISLAKKLINIAKKSGANYVNNYLDILHEMDDIITELKTENFDRPNKDIVYVFSLILLILFGYLNYTNYRLRKINDYL